VISHGLWLYHAYAVQKAVSSIQKKHTNGYNRQDDLIHLSGPVRKKEIQYLVMPHGMLDPYFQRAPDRKLKAVRNWFYYKLVERKVINKADALLFTSRAERELANQPFHPYNPKRELIVGLGVEKPPAYRPEMESDFLNICPELKDSRYILFLSRIHKKKGVDLLVKTYSQLLKRSPAMCSIKLVIAGPGLDSAYGRKIKQMASSFDLKENIFFPGMLTGNAKWGAFYGCEAFVLPSHQENFGIAVVEALACGKPVLISNQVNIWREIEESGGGIVVTDKESGIMLGLQNIFNLSEMERRIMGENAALCYRKYFEKEPAAVSFFRAITDLK
jgi:glycosyltransferase involved in cell wall biosynthesis